MILPKAKQSIDRGSIAQHLLSGASAFQLLHRCTSSSFTCSFTFGFASSADPRCPFTSTPLTLEECVPDVELKAQIDKFVAERKSQIAANKMEVDV